MLSRASGPYTRVAGAIGNLRMFRAAVACIGSGQCLTASHCRLLYHECGQPMQPLIHATGSPNLLPVPWGGVPLCFGVEAAIPRADTIHLSLPPTNPQNLALAYTLQPSRSVLESFSVTVGRRPGGTLPCMRSSQGMVRCLSLAAFVGGGGASPSPSRKSIKRSVDWATAERLIEDQCGALGTC